MTIGGFCGGVAIQIHSTYIDSKVFLITSCGVVAFGYFLIGPCEILPNSIVLMAIGHLIAGYAFIYQSVYSLSEFTRKMKRLCSDRREECADYCSGTLNCVIGIGQAIGPVYGSYMSDLMDFRFT